MNCTVCGKPTKQYKDGHYPKTCSPDCLSKLRSKNSRERAPKVKEMFNPYMERPLSKKPKWEEDMEQRDYLAGVLR